MDIGFILDIIGKNEFVEWHKEYANEKCLDLTEKPFRVTDEKAKKIIYKIS